MKTLLVIAPEHDPIPHDDEQKWRERHDRSPRASLLEETLHADVIDRRSLESLSGIRRRLYDRLPPAVVAALEVSRRGRHYDAVVTWDDRVALLCAGMRLLARGRKPALVAIVSWMPPVKKGMALRLVQRQIDRVIVWGALQKDLLVELFGIAESKIVETSYYVDQQFFRPLDVPTDSICSVGNSKRDYATLVEAMRGLPLTCNIVTQAPTKPLAGEPGDWEVTSRALGGVAEVPENVVIQTAPPLELRAWYARAKFIVAPLFPNLRDHGITTIAEGMAMGKAVIASRIRGLPDFFEDGVTGLLVPPGDPAALREAIQYLWEHPMVADRMGAEGRRRAESLVALDRFVGEVHQVVRGLLRARGVRVPTLAPVPALQAAKPAGAA